MKKRQKRKNDIMTISFGLPGAGKTTLASFEAKKYLKAGYPVWSNVPIKGCYKLEPHIDFGRYNIKNGLVILDECGAEFSNRKFKTNFTDEAMSFVRKYRHAGLRFSIYSQDWDDSDMTFRRLMYNVYYIRQSLIPFFVCRIPIRRRQGISEQTNQPCCLYRFDHPIMRLFTTKRYFAPLVWSMFDSWDMPDLPEKVWETW